MDFIKTYKAGGMKLVIIAFVFFITNKILELEVFSILSPSDTMTLLITIFKSIIALSIIWFITEYTFNFFNKNKIFELDKVWHKIHEIDCNNLVIEHVQSAIKALNMTSIAWDDGIIDRKILHDTYCQDFCLLYDQINNCNKQLNGYTRKIKCKDFITKKITKTYNEMKKY